MEAKFKKEQIVYVLETIDFKRGCYIIHKGKILKYLKITKRYVIEHKWVDDERKFTSSKIVKGFLVFESYKKALEQATRLIDTKISILESQKEYLKKEEDPKFWESQIF